MSPTLASVNCSVTSLSPGYRIGRHDSASEAPGGIVADDQGARVWQAEAHVHAGCDAVFLQATGGTAHSPPELGIGEDAPHTASLVVQLPHRHPVSKAR